MHDHTSTNSQLFSSGDIFHILISLCLILLYLLATFKANKKFSNWPFYRTALWALGILLATLTVTGPFATIAHVNFTYHMVGHLLLGMLVPLLLVFSKPVTLLLRSLPTTTARKLTKVLHTRYFSLLSNPLSVAVLNIGGLYLIYTTSLFEWMHTSQIIYALVHIHVLLAGFLFTQTILAIDLTTKRYSFMYRAIILILALGFHKILSKLIYAQPPTGISKLDGESGALFMYYGGDFIDVFIMILLCYQWYIATRGFTKGNVRTV